jgi:hypothetical protein
MVDTVKPAASPRGRTPLRRLRLADSLYAAAAAMATRKGETFSGLVRRLLIEALVRDGADPL